jgi:hypothetical protein
MRTLRARRAFLAMALAAVGGAAAACPVCFDKPDATLADRLLQAEAVAIAREDPTQTFRFAPVAFLKGETTGEPIALMLDSATRRRLASRPRDGVLLTFDGEGWRRAGYADAAWRATAAAILSTGPAWRDAPEARFTVFEALLHDDDPDPRRLAIDELSRARYGLIRGMERPIDGASARAALTDRSEFPWAGFHILMLGLSDRPEDRALVRERVAAAASFGAGRDLDAWATAWIEIDGAAAVAGLADDWVETPGRAADDVRAVVAALSVHAREGDATLRPSILSALHALRARRPDVGGSVAAALGAIGDFSQAAAIESAMLDAARQKTFILDEPELTAAALHASRARRAARQAASEQETIQ